MARIPSSDQYRSELAREDVVCQSCGKRFRMLPHVLAKVRARGDRVLCMNCLDERGRLRGSRRSTGRPPAENRSDCFIATAVYGSETAPSVIALRDFRDRFLLRSNVGSALVDLYYRFSPAAAVHVKRRPWLRILCQLLLSPLVTVAASLTRATAENKNSSPS